MQLADLIERNEKIEENLKTVERDNNRLQTRNEDLTKKLQIELNKPDSNNSDVEKEAGDLYQLQVRLERIIHTLY